MPLPLIYKRRATRTVTVGDLKIGSEHPIRTQSMTIAKTTDVEATVAEALGLARAGCELIRITAPTIRDAEALKDIRAQLRAQGCQTPLCADIHFMPAAALRAADYVEKVRINPGNYADTKRFAVREYSDKEYNEELERIYEKFEPLVLKLKQNGTALRIGTNHGSLSDRIMNRYGDSPEGMVESAMEFIRICETLNFHNIVVSMKASNPVVMMAAYRGLAKQMEKENMNYPFHLGVTEAGDGEDGRIKSAIGIGALLMDGIGDTVRVSLTEDSIYEIPVCEKLVAPFNRVLAGADPVVELGSLVRDHLPELRDDVEPPQPERRRTHSVHLAHFPLASDQTVASQTARHPMRVEVSARRAEDVTKSTDHAAEILHLSNGMVIENIHGEVPSAITQILVRDESTFEDIQSRVEAALKQNQRHVPAVELVREITHRPEGDGLSAAQQVCSFVDGLERLPQGLNLRASLLGSQVHFAYRLFEHLLRDRKLSIPVVLNHQADESDPEEALVRFARDTGGLVADGCGDAVFIQTEAVHPDQAARWGYGVLQASRARISKTDFISCPSCGRTLFDLQTTTERIRSKMGHLKGVKVAIMGCIVNGPGEMADADFGYVGWGPGKINLYVGKECVERNIPEHEADQRLIELIKRHGRWIEPPAGVLTAGDTLAPQSEGAQP